jgi:anti-sigma28 factor (negative regulator of flagellin synthesis)
MIINNNQTPDVSNLQTTLEKTQAPSRSGAAGASNFATADSTPGDDSISLSNSPNLVQQALSSSSPARSARTQELKALVQNNQFQSDAQELSSALVSAHLGGV